MLWSLSPLILITTNARFVPEIPCVRSRDCVFTMTQATEDAGKIAGLKIERIINEPTAAGTMSICLTSYVEEGDDVSCLSLPLIVLKRIMHT